MSGEESLAAGEVRGASSKFKLAAFGAAQAVALNGVDSADGIEGGFQVDSI